MNKISSEQAKTLIEHIQQAEIVEFFQKVNDYGISDPHLSQFQKEFLHGTYKFDFYERLQGYVNFVANTSYEKKQPKYDIFFSFSSKNQKEAEKEVQKLRKAGFVVFFSDESIKAQIGTTFFEKINDALEHSTHLVLYCTPEAMNSHWVKKEYESFYNNKFVPSKEAQRLFLLEGKKFTTDLLPFLLQDLQRCRKSEEIIRLLQNPSTQAKPKPQKTIPKPKPKVKQATPKPKTEAKAIPIQKYAPYLGLALVVIIFLIWQPWKSTEIKEEPDSLITKTDTNQKEETKKEVEEEKPEEKEENPKLAQIEKLMPRMVNLGNFSIADSETTQALWTAVMGTNPSHFKGCPTCPVEMVSWNDIQVFLQKLNQITGKNYRLPTEQEWEYAAKGGQNYRYAGSDNIGEVAWYDDNSGDKTHPVKQKKPNAYGLYDMSGNVWEWCADWYDSNKIYRVSRGGSWYSRAGRCRVAFRNGSGPEVQFNNDGFRFVF